MLSSAIQRGKLGEHARNALHMQEYQSGADRLHQQFDDHAQFSGTWAGLANRQINQYYFNTARPSHGQGTVVPVSIDQHGNQVDLRDPHSDPLQLVYQWNRQLNDDTYVRGDQRFVQQQAETPSRRVRGIGNSLTREISHPLTGESSNMIQFSYIPAYPSAMQAKKAADVLQYVGGAATRRNVGHYLYWRNPNQSFRYSARK